MEKEKHVLVNSIHRYFGVEFNNTAFKYFDKENKTPDEIEDMIGFAHSSLHHWKLFSGGTIVNVQRGEYMVAKAYALAGNKYEALAHAKKCIELTEKYSGEMKDFDFAFANEVMALAQKINGNNEGYLKYRTIAENLGNEIEDEEDREFYFREFNKYIKKS
jgi:hypothetical protein